MKKPMIIGLKELRENTETYIKHVQKGGSLIVMRRSAPIFKVVPPFEEEDDDDESEWETVVDFTKFREGGVPAKEVLKILKELKS